MRTLYSNATIVNEGISRRGAIVVTDDHIDEVAFGRAASGSFDDEIDCEGCTIIPGVIDEHVHFREPGMTHKADIESESRAAARGGVTSYFDMPNCIPQTTTLDALEEKFRLASQKSHVNYSFFFGATNNNIDLFAQLPKHRIPGIKLFMGSSTGNMLVDRRETLERIFREAELPVMAHCEDTAIISENMRQMKQRLGEDPEIWAHQLIRSEEACLESTTLAIELATLNATRLHVAHVSTKSELDLFGDNPRITSEACVGHLVFSTIDYQRLGSLIKVNPSIKSATDMEALREGLSDGRITTVATDHAPHLIEEKQGGAVRAVSGMPMIQFALPQMLQLTDEGVLTIERMVELMCHNPARLFGVHSRGFIREGYKADLAIVRRGEPWTVSKECIESKCGWSPLEGKRFDWTVERTICNGHPIYINKVGIDRDYIGKEIEFRL